MTAAFALSVVPGRILVPGDIAATAERVRENATLLRLSILAELWQCLFLVFAAIAIFRLLREVDRYLAVVTAALIWISVPIQLLNLVNHMAPLTLTSGTTFLSAFTREQVDGLTYLRPTAREGDPDHAGVLAVQILTPQLAPALSPILLALGIGEIASLVWLVGWGAREPRPSALRTANL